jgi:hypothetical protein
MHPRNPLALCAFAAILFASGAHAATVIESVAGPARVPSLMTVENGKAKLQTDPANYLLIDPSGGQFLYIIPQKKQIVDMNAAPPADAARAPKMSAMPAKVKLVRNGPGPKIAGYSTEGYQLFANGMLCLSTFLSPEAMKRGELTDFQAGFARMQTKQKEANRAAGMRFGPCEDAQDTLMTRYPELGLPMRTMDPNGGLLQEVVRIETGAKVADNLYQLPEGFGRITHEQFLRQMEGTAGTQQAPTK